MSKQRKPYLPDVNAIIAAGINPKNGLPYKFSKDSNTDLKDEINRCIQIVDEQDAINRYVWYNLPMGITPNLIEEVLYHKGQGAFFYMPSNKTFYFLPYCLSGNIDVYGRFTAITPIPLGNSKDENGKDRPWIQGLIKYPKYEPLLEPDLEDFDNSCVLLKDYSSFSQTVIPRKSLNQPIISAMSECIPFMQTALSNSTGVVGMRISDDDCVASVMAANESTKKAALSSQRYIPITSTLEFQELANGSVLAASDFMQAMESLDNFRLGLLGIPNSGLFQKKSHMLQSEQDLSGGNPDLVIEDSLKLRQNFCNIVNSIWGLGIWCELSETLTGIDKNMDGEVSDEEDNQQPVDMTNIGGFGYDDE